MSEPKVLESAATGPLKGVRILDMTSVVFGSYATQMLADLGADVIKVESPPGGPGGGGDIIRKSGTPPEGVSRDLGPIYLTINRNKRSVLLDLRQDKDKRTLRRLIKTCPVFVSSVRYDGMERLGLGYEDVRALRPDVVYVHGAGYGSDGPYAGEPAYDDLIQAACGMADLLPRTDGDPTPRPFPSLMADKVSGHFMAQAILAALYHQAKTGEGQFVEVPMFECMTAFNMTEHLFGRVYDPPTGQSGYSRVCNPERKPYATKDGYIGLLPYTDEQYRRFFKAIGAADTHGADPRFASYTTRSQNVRMLYRLMGEIAATRTTDEWIALLKPLHIPVVRAMRLDEIMDDEHLKVVGLFQRYEHPQAGGYFAMRPPVRYGRTPANIRRHAPLMGEHNAEIEAEAEAAGD